MAKIKIYADLVSQVIHFDGSRIKSKDLGSVEAIEHPSESNRIIVKSTTLFKRESDTDYRVYFRRLKIDRIENEAGQTLVDAPLNYDRAQVLEYLNEQFKKPVITEYFIYNPETDRLEAKKDIEVQKNGFYLGGKHKMASGNSNIYFEDLDNKANSYPVFGEVLDQSELANQVAGQGTTYPKTRIFGDFQSTPLGGAPVNDTAIQYDGDNFFPFNISGVGITTRIAEVIPAEQQLKYEILVNGISVYVQYLEHNGLAINEDLTWYFDQPLDIETNTTLRATIYKVSTVDNQEVNEGILLVCEGDDATTRYQTNVLNRLFEDKDIALKEDLDVLVGGVTYKGSYNDATGTPSLPTGTDVLGDFYKVKVAGSNYNIGDVLQYNGTSYDHYPIENITQNDILTSGIKVHDIYVKSGYAGVSDGTILYPFGDLATALSSANDGDSIYVDGEFNINSEIVLPAGKSLFFYGSDNSCIQYPTYSDGNGNIFYFEGTDNSVEYKFDNIEFKKAGGYALYIKKTSKVTINDCVFKYNGQDGTQLNTVLSSTVTGLLGYDSTNTDLQAFYAGSHASNGGAMRIEEATQLLITGNTVTNNLRGIRVSDCGIGGAGVISRNQSTQNIESGIYLSVGALGGCQNTTVTMNVSAYNANNGLLVIGGINNKFSQNEVNGNWNAGFCAWGSANTTLRDCGLYDNNRSQYNGIGNTGDAKASIQINEAYNLLGTSISLNPAFRFIAEILDTQVHYTGLGSNSDKIGFLITSEVGALVDNPKNIIKVDDVGFIGQDYAIDLSEVDVSNLRLSLGDNSFQSITYKAVKSPLAGNYNELPFSNHVMEVPEVNVVVDTLKHMITLTEGVGGNTINTYQANELSSVISNGHVDILQANTDKIQLRDLSYGNIYINGVIAGNNLNSANDSLNAAFNMDLTQYKDFLVNEVGINGDASSGGSLPAIANNWYISYGSQAGFQIPTSTITNNYRAYNPFYNGAALEKGHEFIWTHNATVDYMIGLWGAAEATQAGDVAIAASNWNQGFKFNATNTRFSQSDSSGVSIETSGSFTGYYSVPNGQLALRFGQDNYLYLFEVVSGGYTLIGKSNSSIAGASVMIQWAAFNQGSFPVMTERTETWEIVHDFDGSENGEWSDGLNEHTVIRSRMSLSPGQKVTMNLNHFGRGEYFGFGYNGAATGVGNAETIIEDAFFYNSAEALKDLGDWTWNTDATYYYNPNGDGSDVGYFMGNGTNIGLISIKYTDSNVVKLFHETNNELIATLTQTKDGSPLNVYFGSSENNHTADRIPTLTKFDMNAEEEVANITGWWYIESPDNNFEYPLFTSEAEAQYIDGVEGGSGTAIAITYADDTTNTQFYYPATSFVNNGSAAPQGGVFGNSINVVWNEKVTDDDANYAATFNSITYNVQEGSSVNIPYKPAGDTAIYNLTNIPNGYADDGFNIIGTAEDISNGYGQAVQHVINVTKVQSAGFPSAQGTITINVKADLAGNEFTLVDDNGVIKFTQDDGITILDFNTVTFNAGSTYKFYLDGTTLQTNDIVNIVDANGNGITGNDGLTQSGGSGPGYTGTYFQYAIPSDVAPGKFITFTDGATSTAYADVPLTIAGSTYTTSVTGVTSEGGTGNLSGTTFTGAQGDTSWLSVDDTLAAGQRIVFDSAFITDLHASMPDYSMVFIGLKADNWTNTSVPLGSHKGNASIRFMKIQGDVGVTGLFVMAFANGTIASQFYADDLTNVQAFIEVTSDGNNIRLGIINSSSYNAATDLYDNWDSNQRVETGDQGYGITTIDPMIYWGTANTGGGVNTAGWNYSEVDWTGLTEISIPVPPTSSSTPFTKAVDFSSSTSAYLDFQGSDSRWPLLKLPARTVAAHASDASLTSNASGAEPFLTSCVFQPGTTGPSDNYGDQSGGRIWWAGQGGSIAHHNIMLEQKGNDIFFSWGQVMAQWPNRTQENQIRVIENADPTKWYGVYLAHRGHRSSSPSAADLGTMFDIYVMSSDDSFTALGSNISTASEWGESWNETGHSITGGMTSSANFGFGGLGGSSSIYSFSGKIASFVCHPLLKGVAMPDAAEAKKVIVDPIGWANDLVGTTQVNYVGGGHTFAIGSTTSALSTQLYTFGDGPNDSFSGKIKNQIHEGDTNYTPLVFNNMQASDIVNMPSIPGLS